MEQQIARPGPGKRRAKFMVGGALIALALLGLVAWAMARPGSTSFYMTVSEVRSGPIAAGAEEVKVNGKVVPGSVEQEGLETTFAITDGTAQLDVYTRSSLPDAFYSATDQVEVIAQGRWDGDTFRASNVFAKCPSKFKAKT